MASVNGSALAVREALTQAAAGGGASAEQLALLEAGGGEAILPVGRRITGDAVEAGARERRAGRPPGATSLATRELRRALHTAGLDSVWEMARWAMLSPEELAKRLGCSLKDAFDRKMQLLDNIARYQHTRLAPTDDKGNTIPMMAMFIGGQMASPDMPKPTWGGRTVDAEAAQAGEQYQGLEHDPRDAAHAAPAHDEEKP